MKDVQKPSFFLSGFVIALLTSLTLNAQSQLAPQETVEVFKKIDESLNKLKTVVYKIDYENKYLSRRDTIHTTAICSLYMAPKDKMKVYHIVDLEFRELKNQTYGRRKYDGKKALWVNYPVDSLDIYKEPLIEKGKQMKISMIQNYDNLLLANYLTEEKPFERYGASAEVISATEEIYNNIPVYVFMWGFKEPDDICGEIEGIVKHIIRKSDYLPLVYANIQKCENMLQYRQAEIEYLAVNPDIPIEEFKIDEKDKVNCTERYKEYKEKTVIKNRQL